MKIKIDKVYSKKIDTELNPLHNPETSRKALWAVVASDEEGHRYQHKGLFRTETEAEAFAQKVTQLDELPLEGWEHASPVYGSKAYWENPYSND